jgi:hypothetical protein
VSRRICQSSKKAPTSPTPTTPARVFNVVRKRCRVLPNDDLKTIVFDEPDEIRPRGFRPKVQKSSKSPPPPSKPFDSPNPEASSAPPQDLPTSSKSSRNRFAFLGHQPRSSCQPQNVHSKVLDLFVTRSPSLSCRRLHPPALPYEKGDPGWSGSVAIIACSANAPCLDRLMSIDRTIVTANGRTGPSYWTRANPPRRVDDEVGEGEIKSLITCTGLAEVGLQILGTSSEHC